MIEYRNLLATNWTLQLAVVVLMDDSSYRLNFDLDMEFAPLLSFEPKVVQTSACVTKVYKLCEICRAIFSAFYNISRPNFAILLILLVVYHE